MTQILPFRVFHATSSDSSHPAQILASADDYEENGWQSQRFCTYPQEIIVQFEAPVQITQMQLLCHEIKIPRQIELFAYMPGTVNENEVSPASAYGQSQLITPLTSDLLFKRLGHFSLDSN